MPDLWTRLAEQTRAWSALERQSLADAVWHPYVIARFGRSGNARALPFLYPYLSHADRQTRHRAIDAAGRVFEGQGPEALDQLEYFTRNTDTFLRDRAVLIVGAALTDHPDEILLDLLKPYLEHKNRFVRRSAITALCRAAAGRASQRLLKIVLEVEQRQGSRIWDLEYDIGRLFAGRPTEAAYELVTRPEADEEALGIMLQGAADEWFERGCRECFNRDPRWGMEGLAIAARGRGVKGLEPLLPLCRDHLVSKALMARAPACFDGVAPAPERGALEKLVRSGDLPVQRLAALCLGRLLVASEDRVGLDLLRPLLNSRNGSVRAAALAGLGQIAQSACDETLLALCLDHARDGETARAAVEALGRVFAGSGRFDLFAQLRDLARNWHARPPGRKQYRPLVECYHAVGRIYQGTGLEEPFDFLLDALAPSPRQWCSYRVAAARALIHIEFSPSALERVYRSQWEGESPRLL